MEIQLDAADVPATPMTPLACATPAPRWWQRALTKLRALFR